MLTENIFQHSNFVSDRLNQFLRFRRCALSTKKGFRLLLLEPFDLLVFSDSTMAAHSSLSISILISSSNSLNHSAGNRSKHCSFTNSSLGGTFDFRSKSSKLKSVASSVSAECRFCWR